MDPLTFAAISLGSNAVSSIFGSSQARKEREARRRAEEDARQHNIRMWNMQNEYNHPSAQMARLQEAGLNPNMIYGTPTAAATGQAGDIAKGQAPEQSYYKDLDFDAMTPLVQHQNVEQSKAQVDNLRTQNQVLTQEANWKAAQEAGQLINNAKNQFEFDIAKELRETSLEAARENLRLTQQETMGRYLDNYYKDKTLSDRVHSIALQIQNARANLKGTQLANKMKQFEVELNQLGLTKSDPLIMRLIETGQTPRIDSQIDNWLDQGIDNISDKVRDALGPKFKKRFPKR